MHAWESIQIALEYIEEHISEDIGIDELAKVAMLSPFYFQRLFSKLVENSVRKYIKLRRLARAEIAVKAGEQRLLDIALDVGFGGHETFTRAFKETYGITPEQYRSAPAMLNSQPIIDLRRIYLMQNAIFTGVWPITAPHDPDLDAETIPTGAAVYALIGSRYERYKAPPSIPGLTKVSTHAELKQDTWFELTTNGFCYVITMVDKPEDLTITMEDIMTNVKVINVYKQQMPTTRFIGKKYDDSDRVNGLFSAKWGEWSTNGWFNAIDGVMPSTEFFEDSNACIGLMREKDGEPFEYWIGKFTPANTTVPDGYSYLDFKPNTIGVCWLRGPENEIYGQDGMVMQAFENNGISAEKHEDGAWWFFERYATKRFTADSEGYITLDHCYFI